MIFSPAFLEELGYRTALADLIARKVKLQRRGREHVGLCPFHSEKTPSFTVNEEKGFYHCFGCGAHGDAIRFLMQTENVTFRDAVERLAREAGLEVPRPTKEEAQKAERRAGLYEIMEMAASWYEGRLFAEAGTSARSYLRDRGLNRAALGAFRIGFAPASRTALKEAMLARDISEDQLVEAGLLIRPEDGRASFDRFRNRVMFPIVDAQDRVVAFGGRALDDAPAKYMNSPETPVFSKGRMLYNMPRARRTARDAGTVILAEGYMDVVALYQAGIEHAVAPLGTAVTEDQIKLLWRFADEPVLCFDGDRAGRKAALRSVERALPIISAGKSLCFVWLPEGEDPDTYVRAQGAAAFISLVKDALPLAEVLWQSLTRGSDIATPERRVGLESKVMKVLGDVGDEKLRYEYRRDYGARLRDLFGNQWGGRQMRGAKGPGKRSPWRRGGGLKNTLLGQVSGEGAVTQRIEELILLSLLNHPALMEAHGEDIMRIGFRNPQFEALRSELINYLAEEKPLETEDLAHHLLEKGFETIYTRITNADALRQDWFAWPAAALADAEKGLLHTLARFALISSLEEEKRSIEITMQGYPSEEDFDRLKAINKELRAAPGREADVEGYGVASEKRLTY